MSYEKIKTSKGYIYKKIDKEKESIAKQKKLLESGAFELIDFDTPNGKTQAIRAVNPLDTTNYNEDTIYQDLNGRYKNIFSHMNMLWCDGHGFEDCEKCSMYARMLVEVFDKINKLSGRDMSQDLCSYSK